MTVTSQRLTAAERRRERGWRDEQRASELLRQGSARAPRAAWASACATADSARRRVLGRHSWPCQRGGSSPARPWLCGAAAEISPVPPESSDRYGRAAGSRGPRNPSPRPGSLPEGRVRGGRGAVLRVHSPVRLHGFRRSARRQVTIARSASAASCGRCARPAELRGRRAVGPRVSGAGACLLCAAASGAAWSAAPARGSGHRGEGLGHRSVGCHPRAPRVPFHVAAERGLSGEASPGHCNGPSEAGRARGSRVGSCRRRGVSAAFLSIKAS